MFSLFARKQTLKNKNKLKIFHLKIYFFYNFKLDCMKCKGDFVVTLVVRVPLLVHTVSVF